MTPELGDPFGFGPEPFPAHRKGVTACPCPDCVRGRGIGLVFQAQAEAVRSILYLKWLRWFLRERDRKHWPAVHTAEFEGDEDDA